MGLEELAGKELPELNSNILIEAEAFYRIGVVAFKEMEDAIKEDGEFLQKIKIFPAIVNTALACELYLKNLLFEKEGYIKKEHRLNELFNKLDDTVKRIIKETIISSKEAYTSESFDMDLINISNAFVDWRYYYEPEKTGKPLNLEFLKIFAYALHRFIVVYKEN